MYAKTKHRLRKAVAVILLLTIAAFAGIAVYGLVVS